MSEDKNNGENLQYSNKQIEVESNSIILTAIIIVCT